MATYIGIKGVEIQTIAGDPANPIEGQVWYNTTANTLKGYGKQGTGAWATTTSIPAGKEFQGQAGTPTAFLVFGGTSPTVGTTFEFDGTNWTTVNSMQDGRNAMGGSGVQSAAWCAGGAYTNKTEEYDGTSWSSGNVRPFTAGYGITAGTQTAGISGTGYAPTIPGDTDLMATYDGTSWTSVAVYPASCYYTYGAGTQTAAIGTGGETAAGAAITSTNLFDGTAWSATTSLNTVRERGQAGGAQTACLITGGLIIPPYAAQSLTEEYNGTSWAEVGDLTEARKVCGYGFSMTAAATTGLIVGGGTTPTAPLYAVTYEEWTVPNATKTFTSS